MLDLNLFRKDRGGNPDLVRESQRRRGKDAGLVDEVLELDAKWRTLRYELDNVSKERNELNKQMKEIMTKRNDPTVDPDGKRAADIKQKKKALADGEAATREKVVEVEKARDAKVRTIGNLVHESVPVAVDEEKNRVERTFPDDGELPAIGGHGRNHVDLLHMIGGVEYERGVATAGSRGYFLKGDAVLLNLALVQYGLQFLVGRGFTAVQPPYFMNRETMAKCAQLDDFDEQLYKVTGDGEKYLIATSEQPLCVYHLDEWVPEKELPRKFAGYSTNFRKEAGSHGRDQLGIFRVHQFDKIEQFVVTKPDDGASWEMLETLIGNAEEFYTSLGLPYQVVSIVSGALNDAAAKKYDLEGWFPASKAFRELVSASNCTDYQARRLETRCGSKKMSELNAKKYVHMLNSTLCATTRVICCILENFQTDEGVVVPEVLRPYMGGKELIPFVCEPPKIKKPKKEKGKAKATNK